MAKDDDNASAVPPISETKPGRALAPWPVIDRYPIIAGQQLSLQYFASVYRTALTGYRFQLVDLLDELIQKDPHAYGVVWKRILGVAGARLEVEPAKLAKGDKDEALAEEIADRCREQLESIPNLRQHLAALAWATYYAIVGSEIYWDRDDDGGWRIERLGFVHSRRFSYPDGQTWDLHIWDQGQVYGFQAFGAAPTNQIFGLRIKDYPDKFIVHAPQLRGDYPTREGIGIQMAEWMIFKRLGARKAIQYLERFASPWPEAVYSTTPDGKPREAAEEDIEAAEAAMEALGLGSLSSYTHPDTVQVKLLTPDSGANSKITFKEFNEICNSELSKPALGNTLTTDVGQKGGNRALGQVQEHGELRILRYDAQALCDSLEHQLLRPFVRLNYGPDVAKRLCPRMFLHVEEPDPMALLELADKGARAGIAVDGDAVADEIGLPTVPIDAEPGKARRMVPMDVVDPLTIDPGLAEVAKQIAPPAPEQTPPPPDAKQDDAPPAPPTKETNGVTPPPAN